MYNWFGSCAGLLCSRPPDRETDSFIIGGDDKMVEQELFKLMEDAVDEVHGSPKRLWDLKET